MLTIQPTCPLSQLLLDPTPYRQPEGTHWCIPASLALVASASGICVTHAEILRAYLDDHGHSGVAVDDVRTDEELLQLTGLRFGPAIATSFLRLCQAKQSVQPRTASPADRPELRKLIEESIRAGKPLAASMDLRPDTLGGYADHSIHIMPWIGVDSASDQFIAWEPVQGVYIVGASDDVEKAFREDLWYFGFQ